MEASKSALGAVILNNKTGEFHRESIDNDTVTVTPLEIINPDLEARKWLIKNIDTLKDIVNEHLTKPMVDDLCQPIFGVKLKRPVGVNNTDTRQTIIVASTNRNDISHVVAFLNRLREESKNGIIFHSIRYILAHKGEMFLHDHLEELYEFDTVVEIYEDGLPEGAKYINFENYASSLDNDLFQMLRAKMMLNLWERLTYRKELKAVTAFKLWYEIEIREDI